MADKRIALVTGANKGIGREIARQLGRLDHVVWLGCRDEGRGRKAEEELRSEAIDARFVQLDITDEASVHAAVAAIRTVSPHLDVLVNNVGMSGNDASQPSEETIDDIRPVFETNVFGTIRVTQSFVPMLRKSSMARIVNMSSAIGSIGLTSDFRQPIWGMTALGYASSKAALNMFTVKLAKELLADGIKVNSACPGATDTDMAKIKLSGLRTIDQAARIAVRLATLSAMGPTGGLFHDGEGPGIPDYSGVSSYPW